MTLGVGEAKHWTYRTKRCKLFKNDIGHWCGYARTALRGFHEDDLFDVGGHESVRVLEVHGGMTYGPDDDGWVGFDCGHARDLCLDEHGGPGAPSATVRTGTTSKSAATAASRRARRPTAATSGGWRT